jgi:hypothetical protein
MPFKLMLGLRRAGLTELSLRLGDTMRHAVALRLRLVLLAFDTFAHAAQIDDLSHR